MLPAFTLLGDEPLLSASISAGVLEFDDEAILTSALELPTEGSSRLNFDNCPGPQSEDLFHFGVLHNRNDGLVLVLNQVRVTPLNTHPFTSSGLP